MRKTAALIVGAGAVEQAWDPVLRALQPLYDFPLTSDGANSFMARLVYLLRWWCSDPSDLGKSEKNKHLNFLRQIREAIAHEICQSELRGSISARKELEVLFREWMLPYGNRFILLTTNWDTVVANSIQNFLREDFKVSLNPLHIHGSAADPNTLYLPSEMTKEPYRSRAEENAIGTTHGTAWRALETAQRVVIYGLSLDPLDAELGQTLACGLSNPGIEEILIVNPNHAAVAHRINLLLDFKREIRVTGLNPISMEAEADYTIRRSRT